MWLFLNHLILQAHAASVQVPPGIPNPAEGASAESVIVGAINWAIGIAGAVALIYIIVGAFFYITAAGDTEKLEKAKKTIRNAIIGLVFLLISAVIVREVINLVGPGTSGGGPSTGGARPSTTGATPTTGTTTSTGPSASTPNGPPTTPSEVGFCTVSIPGRRQETMNATKAICDAALAQCQLQNPQQQASCSARWDKINTTLNTGNIGCTIRLPTGSVQTFPSATFEECNNATSQCTQNLGGISTGQSCSSEWNPPQ